MDFHILLGFYQHGKKLGLPVLIFWLERIRGFTFDPTQALVLSPCFFWLGAN
jgi:hypothetical protein